MKTRMVFAGAAALGVATLMWCCDQTGKRGPVTEWTTPIPIPGTSQPATQVARGGAATIPAQIIMTKPQLLGPPAPTIVALPEQIDEPLIRVRLTDQLDKPPTIPAGKYRGRVETLRLPNGKYVALNTLPLDSYLQGVLAKELYGTWDPATYRAQAIAARTFALFQMCTDGRNRQWDVNDDESSQVYGGIAGETAKARTAVADTRGQVLTAEYDGRVGIFCSRFSACIGGASQDPNDAWGDPTPSPLAARLTGNVDENSDKFNWDRTFAVTKADMTRCIQNWGLNNGFAHLQTLGKGRPAARGVGRGGVAEPAGQIETVVISKRNAATSRPTELLLTDTAGKSAPIRAEEFRLALLYDPLGKAPKPYSSNFEIRSVGNTFVMYNGHGYGHGIGLSQWGAQNMARKGYSHTQILAFFYPGAGMKQLW